MTVEDVHQIESPPEQKPTVGDVIDYAGTVLAGGLIALGVFSFCVTLVLFNWATRNNQPIAERVIWTTVAIVVGTAEAFSIVFGYRRLTSEITSSVLVTLALGQRRWPLLLRPIVAAWWLAHQAIMVIGTSIVVRAFAFPDVSTYVDCAARVIQFLLYLAGSACGNAFLFLAVSSIWPTARAVRRLHRFRYAIDLLVAIALAFSPSLRRFVR